jgi:hypothetical protein
VDTHWIGGNPAKGEVYGWASWSPRKGILVLRNPDDRPASFTMDANQVFELPSGVPEQFVLHSPWKKDRRLSDIILEKDQPCTLTLKPFEVLTLEGRKTR